MIIGKAIGFFLQNMVTKISADGFPIVSEILYSPQLHFNPELRKYIIDQDVSFKDTTGLENWIGLIWNREAIKPSQDIPKRLTLYTENIVAKTGKTYRARIAEAQVSMAFVGTSLAMLETLEEDLLASNTQISFEVTTDLVDIVTSVREFELTSITKEETTTYGSLATLGCNAVLTFPVIQYDQNADVKLITEINFNIYNNFEVLLSSRTITP